MDKKGAKKKEKRHEGETLSSQTLSFWRLGFVFTLILHSSSIPSSSSVSNQPWNFPSVKSFYAVQKSKLCGVFLRTVTFPNGANPSDLLGDDAEDLSQLIAAKQLKAVAAPKKEQVVLEVLVGAPPPYNAIRDNNSFVCSTATTGSERPKMKTPLMLRSRSFRMELTVQEEERPASIMAIFGLKICCFCVSFCLRD